MDSPDHEHRKSAKTKTKGNGKSPALVKPLELLISPSQTQETFDYYAPNRNALCQAFTRAIARLREMLATIESDPTNFELHRARHMALTGTLEPWWQVHQLRAGLAFQAQPVDPAVLNDWLEDLIRHGRISDEHRQHGERFRQSGEELGAFCWELAFPEVFFDGEGNRRPDAGFSCVLGNPPWDKIKAERDGFYLTYDPLIRQIQGTEKNRRIEELHRENPAIAEAWQRYESSQRALADVLLSGGIYAHQTAVIEEEVVGEDGEPVIKRKTTGGDPDCFKFFLERAWQLVAPEHTVGMVMSSSLHNGHGATGLRRLILDQCRLRVLCNFDNERKIFPGIDNRQDFDIVVFNKGGSTETFDAAFLTRETEQAIQRFRSHRSYLVLPAADIRQLSPQTLTFFEFRGQRDVDLVQKAYRLHPTFGDGLMPRLGLRFCREFDMGNSNYLFRTRDWLSRHGCTQEMGEQWRAASADWYRGRGYIERPIAAWYVLFEGDRAKTYELPWPVKSSKSIKESQLADFDIRLNLPGGYRLIAQSPDDDGCTTAFIPPDETRDADLPAYLPGLKKLGTFTLAPALRSGDVFLPLFEGKWIYLFEDRAYAYVSGSGSWVVTRPMASDEHELLPHYFMARLDAETNTAGNDGIKIGYRDVSSSTDERTIVAAPIPSHLPCNHKTPTFASSTATEVEMLRLVAWLCSLPQDYIARTTGGNTGLFAVEARPAPVEELLRRDGITELIGQLVSRGRDSAGASPSRASDVDHFRAVLDAIMAELCELTPREYAYILSTFPLLDRDQPPLPHDYRIRPTNKGLERRQISFITRDLALLTYFDYLAGRLEVKPDPERLARICPDDVPDPPSDIVQFFAEAGVDIGGQTDYAVAATGPFRDLRDRVAKARELGAIAYIPTIDRRRARFVEAAAAAGGLAPEEGVLTPEMAQRVLRDKAEREAKWQRAMELWAATPAPGALAEPAQVAATEPEPEAAAEVATPAPKKRPSRVSTPQFRQAAVMALLVDEILKTDKPPTRFRVQKHLYFAQQLCGLDLGLQFQHKAAGPYAPSVRYGGPEDIAVNRKRWLTASGTTFGRGPAHSEGVGFAQRYIGAKHDELRSMLKHFAGYEDDALGRWATIFDATVDLTRSGRPVTLETVKEYLANDPEWSAKLDQAAYGDDQISRTLYGLKRFGFMK